jgi:hypothetical protein
MTIVERDFYIQHIIAHKANSNLNRVKMINQDSYKKKGDLFWNNKKRGIFFCKLKQVNFSLNI